LWFESAFSLPYGNNYETLRFRNIAPVLRKGFNTTRRSKVSLDSIDTRRMMNFQEQPTRWLEQQQQQNCGGSFAADSFGQTLEKRLVYLLEENATTREEMRERFCMPIALILVLDKDNGGDATAEELVRRFKLLDSESGTAIDFYFLGWTKIDTPPHIEFDLDAFYECRHALEGMGVKRFGGYADLILVDVSFWYEDQTYLRYTLNFPQAIYVELGHKEKIGPVGEFLQELIQAATEIKEAGSVDIPTYRISDKLGLAIAKRSFLEFVFEKWGKLIGASKLERLAVRNVGRIVDFSIPGRMSGTTFVPDRDFAEREQAFPESLSTSRLAVAE
jgi:hypothetical protein